MLDPKEIDLEIARLEYGESSYPAYAKLATLYTIKHTRPQKWGRIFIALLLKNICKNY